jgi:hypothetical protein
MNNFNTKLSSCFNLFYFQFFEHCIYSKQHKQLKTQNTKTVIFIPSLPLLWTNHIHKIENKSIN